MRKTRGLAMAAAAMTRTVGIFVFDEVEVLDRAGPDEVFTTAA